MTRSLESYKIYLKIFGGFGRFCKLNRRKQLKAYRRWWKEFSDVLDNSDTAE